MMAGGELICRHRSWKATVLHPYLGVIVSNRNNKFTRWILPAACMAAIGAACSGPRTTGTQKEPLRIGLVMLSEMGGTAAVHAEIANGLRRLSRVEGKDYVLSIRSAQNELSLLPSIVDEAAANSDLLICAQSAVLQTVVGRKVPLPVVFSVFDPFALGVGTSDTDHPPNITGVYRPFPAEPFARLVRTVLPSAKTLGILYNTAEVQSEQNVRSLRAAADGNWKVEAVSVASAIEAVPATQALIARGAEAIVVNGAVPVSAFAAIVTAADRARVPIFTHVGPLLRRGALATLDVNPRFQADDGAAFRMIVQVMDGISPARIPYHRIGDTPIAINLEKARALGLTIPDAALGMADSLHGER
jgi:ABC-type uncharacterized transport system substrate-binding protein